MSDQLQVLKSQAKASMQGLVDRALVQDEVSKYKRLLFKRAYRAVGVSISFPLAVLLAGKLLEMGSFARGFTAGTSNVFLWHGRQVRELYAPEVYHRDQRLRPYESEQFR